MYDLLNGIRRIFDEISILIFIFKFKKKLTSKRKEQIVPKTQNIIQFLVQNYFVVEFMEKNFQILTNINNYKFYLLNLADSLNFKIVFVHVFRKIDFNLN